MSLCSMLDLPAECWPLAGQQVFVEGRKEFVKEKRPIRSRVHWGGWFSTSGKDSFLGLMPSFLQAILFSFLMHDSSSLKIVSLGIKD